ncbi:MAG: bifunctional 4-hydroxy-2-oxoglutarate aldolase/2-dehydro-3-deoxy-phosphogluconate aldolase [Clostridiales bacterium]|jgi:2-dehydro-3-deoxyphosphogluconate aldolase/(4S)-4-hydroxy-2-oxoglutarate aldolase|nr:bifunctional 4-hydroxy-2-oxoglutarate aldolase/2-dehydro-3-deoxy-phosphogluconate aldolase [Clostridiales bacterium]
MRNIITKNPIIAILRNVPSDILIPYVSAVLDGGIKTLEIAMNTQNGAQQIYTIKKHFGDKIIIGAGTAITKERIDTALEAGAEFFLTPSVREDILQYFNQLGLPVLPGIMTPSDVDLCLKYGFDTFKLFPAGDLPMSYIKSLKGPFDTTEYVAVGGVTLENLSDFMNEGYIGVGIASNLIPKDYIQTRSWKEATDYVRKYVEQCK